jgi:hypothetical protein
MLYLLLIFIVVITIVLLAVSGLAECLANVQLTRIMARSCPSALST